jgi:hypothetical protein
MSREFPKHPASLIALIRQRYGVGISFEFSRYFYRPRSVEDERQIFQTPGFALTEAYVSQLMTSLPPGYELALNSRVYFGPNTYMHIPMIDCAARRVEEITKIYDLLPSELAKSFFWYNSGRSFHGYGIKLLQPSEWIEFMGRLLLVNTPGHQSVIDPRWVGHRLMASYSALRWSWNTSQYLHEPRFVQTWMAPSSV